MGAEIEESHGHLHCKVTRLKGAEIQLDYPSVGATENIILAGVKAEREQQLLEMQLESQK